jgi:hypothetical protein
VKAAARLTGELLARRGEAMPTGGFAAPGHAIGLAPPASPSPLRAAGTGGDERPRLLQSRGKAERVALTVRLDRERHRRLRIFGARRGCSNQEVILKALDAYLAACGVDCACLRGEAGDCIRI